VSIFFLPQQDGVVRAKAKYSADLKNCYLAFFLAALLLSLNLDPGLRLDCMEPLCSAEFEPAKIDALIVQRKINNQGNKYQMSPLALSC
jgi:hypothetical protein